VSSDAKSLPSDLAAAHAMILAERAARIAAEAERDQSRSAASQTDALVAHLSLECKIACNSDPLRGGFRVQ